MTGNELFKALYGGNTVTCKTVKGIFEDFDFGDEGMIVDVHLIRIKNDLFEVQLDGNKYVDHNHNIAPANWYDSNHQPTLKYFETNGYTGKEVETLYCSEDEFECGLEIVVDDSLMSEYLQLESDYSYLIWLENMVAALREAK